MSELRVVGVDPGPVPGLVVLNFSDPALLEVDVAQTTPELCSLLLEALLRESASRHTMTIVQVEQFVVRGRAGRSSTPGAGRATRELIGALQRVCAYREVAVLTKGAGNVKPWATDDRLERAGLLAATKGMRHARDAARHALFAAVHDGEIPDPLSKEWRY